MENIIEKLWSCFLQEKTQKVPKNSQTNPLGLHSPKYFHYEHFIQTNKFMNTNISTNKFGEYFEILPGQFSPDKTFEKNDFINNLSTSEDEKKEKFIDLYFHIEKLKVRQSESKSESKSESESKSNSESKSESESESESYKEFILLIH